MKRFLLLGTVFQQILQLRHELLHVLEVHVHGSESHVSHFIEFLQPVHDHFPDFRGGQLAFRSFMHRAFDFIHDGLELRCRYRPLLARFQQSLQDFLTLEALPPPVLLDHHVRNFVDALVSGEAPFAFQAFAPPADRIARPPFPRIDHFVVQMPAKWTLHSSGSPRWRSSWRPAASAMSRSSAFSSAASSRSLPSETPS